MYTNEDIASLLEAVRGGEAVAFMPLADALGEAGDPDADEFADLARTITEETDWAVVMYAMAVFQELLKGRGL